MEVCFHFLDLRNVLFKGDAFARAVNEMVFEEGYALLVFLEKDVELEEEGVVRF